VPIDVKHMARVPMSDIRLLYEAAKKGSLSVFFMTQTRLAYFQNQLNAVACASLYNETPVLSKSF
jgi:hypothetical protein